MPGPAQRLQPPQRPDLFHELLGMALVLAVGKYHAEKVFELPPVDSSFFIEDLKEETASPGNRPHGAAALFEVPIDRREFQCLSPANLLGQSRSCD